MPLDHYATATPGALRLKGSKIFKPKKKSKKSKNKDLTTSATSGGESSSNAKRKEGEEDEEPMVQKTEAQIRHEEMKKKRLLELAEKAGEKPELLKTHKERVEELNTFLSKLSEHNDMPKIGPG